MWNGTCTIDSVLLAGIILNENNTLTAKTKKLLEYVLHNN